MSLPTARKDAALRESMEKTNYHGQRHQAIKDGRFRYIVQTEADGSFKCRKKVLDKRYIEPTSEMVEEKYGGR